MSQKSRKNPSRAAFIPLGIALMVVGLNNNTGLIGAGAVFLIIGMSAVVKSRKGQAEESRGTDDEPQS